MSIGVIFWVLMILWFVLGLYVNWPADRGQAPMLGGTLLLFILLFLLGWAAFGFVVQGPGAPVR